MSAEVAQAEPHSCQAPHLRPMAGEEVHMREALLQAGVSEAQVEGLVPLNPKPETPNPKPETRNPKL